jgi:hypothetical protein
VAPGDNGALEDGGVITIDIGDDDGGDEGVVIEGSVAPGDDGAVEDAEEDGEGITMDIGDDDGGDDAVVIEGKMRMGVDGAALRSDDGDKLPTADGDELAFEESAAVGAEDRDTEDGDALGADTVGELRSTLRIRPPSLSAM